VNFPFSFKLFPIFPWIIPQFPLGIPISDFPSNLIQISFEENLIFHFSQISRPPGPADPPPSPHPRGPASLLAQQRHQPT
jgi:hypothetical protein